MPDVASICQQHTCTCMMACTFTPRPQRNITSGHIDLAYGRYNPGISYSESAAVSRFPLSDATDSR